jgi:hypothetical protein
MRGRRSCGGERGDAVRSSNTDNVNVFTLLEYFLDNEANRYEALWSRILLYFDYGSMSI